MNAVSASNLDEVKTLVNDAMADRQRLEIVAGGSKRLLGRAAPFDQIVDVRRMAGIIDYQPEELVLTLRAGTPMAEVEAALVTARQMLAFDPPDYGHLLGGGNAGTIGGIVATNLSGPRRLTAGAARDYLLGFEAISGRGELFKSGGKVMKNVTGYDLSKLMTGSFGTLAVMDEITLKTLPCPETSCSLVVQVEDFTAATKQIAALFATPHEPGSAAILPAKLAQETGVLASGAPIACACACVIRLEGIAVSVADRLAHLQKLTGGHSLDEAVSTALWQQIRDVRLLDDPATDIWKLSCAPADAASVLDIITRQHDVTYFADWAGGLIWIAGRGAALGTALRMAVAHLPSGFVMLMRSASDTVDTRDQIAPMQPLAGPLAGLHRRVKAAFDPLGVLNFGRMHDGI